MNRPEVVTVSFSVCSVSSVVKTALFRLILPTHRDPLALVGGDFDNPIANGKIGMPLLRANRQLLDASNRRRRSSTDTYSRGE